MRLNPIDNHQVMTDFITFGQHHLASNDIDPAYPVLRTLYDDLSVNQRCWFTMLYLGFYDLGSAMTVWESQHRVPMKLDPRMALLPCATERRGLRGGKINEYITGLWLAVTNDRATPGGLAGLLTGDLITPTQSTEGYRDQLLPGELATYDQLRRYANYERLWRRVQRLPHVGRWAAFKLLEILRRVHDVPIEAPDMRLKFCSGPRRCLEWLFGYERAATHVELLEALALELQHRCADGGLDLDLEHLETVLCDFWSLRQGHYYIGHDIDAMQASIRIAAERFCNSSNLVGLSPYGADLLWSARRRALPAGYLGELHPSDPTWTGVDRNRSREYQRNGTIVLRRSDGSSYALVTNPLLERVETLP